MFYIIIWIIYSIILFKVWNDHVFFYIDFYKTFTLKDRIKYKYYWRNDIQNMNKFIIYLKGFFLIPIRIIWFSLILISLFFSLKIWSLIMKIKDFEIEQSKIFWYLSNYIINLHLKIYCFVLGFRFKYNLIKSNKPSTKKERENAKIMVSNHSSWLDAQYFFTNNLVPSMVVNHHFKDFYFFGFFCKVNQNIFLNRGESSNINNKKEVLNKLNQRVNYYKEGKIFKPILMFPEGTTCNSNIILPFKKGAFTTDLSVRMFVFDYRNNYIIPEYTLFDRIGGFWLYITNISNHIIVNEIDYLLNPNNFKNLNGELDSEKMANECRKIMAESIGLEEFNCDNIYERVSEYIQFQKLKFKILKKERYFFNIFKK